MSAPSAKSSSSSVSFGSAMGDRISKLTWKDLLKHTDIILSLGVVMIVGMMIIPMPPLLLDILLTINIALSVTILLVTLFTQEALQYSTFPTILLVSTMFRLGLNISSTRLILLNGSAGDVIQSFGNFVVGGNYVVGILIFVILNVINFIVITNGAGRVSEVAARFTLDAMPGKQLSIDADLNAGVIDDKTAKMRRQKIQREADFYGTMDGASKFVKGDAIASIIITIINVVAGLIIGVVQMNMPIMEAAATFTILSVGDGLVSQLPALIISTATGILVTRVSSEERQLGEDIGQQMFSNPKVVMMMGGVLCMLGLVPGMPTLPFVAIGGIALTGGYFLIEHLRNESLKKKNTEEEAAKAKIAQQPKATTENVMQLLQVEPLELEIGYRLVPLLEAESGGDLLDRIAQIRRQLALEIGFVLPSIRVRDNLQLPPNEYQIKLRGVMVDKGEVMSEMWLAMNTDPEMTVPMNGIETEEPAFGLPALWIPEAQKEDAEINGYTVVSASAVIATHLTETLKRNSAKILSRLDVEDLLEHTKKTAESLVTDLIPDQMNVAQVHVILQNLLQEKVSIRDLIAILESLSYHCRVSKDLDYLSEQCRMALSRSICKQHMDPDSGELPVITLAPDLEEQLAQTLPPPGSHGSDDGYLAISPTMTQQLLNALNSEVERILMTQGLQPVILCNARLRLPFRRLIERMLPQIAVMSYNEVGPSIKVRALGSVSVAHAHA